MKKKMDENNYRDVGACARHIEWQECFSIYYQIDRTEKRKRGERGPWKLIHGISLPDSPYYELGDFEKDLAKIDISKLPIYDPSKHHK